MSGFVDVSGMTSEDVRRMGHADDYDQSRTFKRNPYAYRKPMNKTPKIKINHNADDVWAAAVAAQRINGAYVKLSQISESDPALTKKSNRMIVESLLTDPTTIADEDRELGRKVRSHYQAFTFKILQGKQLNEFNNTAMLIANRDVITSTYDVAVIASLPSSYEKAVKSNDVTSRINFARGGFIGDVNDKVTLNIEVLKQVYSQKFATWYLTGITGEDQVVFFACRENYDVGNFLTITGKVKSHRENSTQLSHVKVL